MSSSPGWDLLCFLRGLSTPQHACNKVVLCARVRLPPSVPAPHDRAPRWDSTPPSGFWRQRPRSPAPWAVRPLSPASEGGGVWRGRARRRPRPPAPAPPLPHGRVGSACVGHMSRPPASPGPAPCRPCHPRRPRRLRPPLAAATGRPAPPAAALRCLRPGLGRGPRRSRPPLPVPARRARARAMGLWLPPPPAPPG